MSTYNNTFFIWASRNFSFSGCGMNSLCLMLGNEVHTYSIPFSLTPSSSPRSWPNIPSNAAWVSTCNTDTMPVFTSPRSVGSSENNKSFTYQLIWYHCHYSLLGHQQTMHTYWQQLCKHIGHLSTEGLISCSLTDIWETLDSTMTDLRQWQCEGVLRVRMC